MSWAYLHLLINHFPIVGVIIGSLLLITGLRLKNEGVIISGLGIVVFAAVMAVITYITGDPAKDALKGLPDVAESLINRHEDIATVSMYLLIPAGLLAAMTIYSIWKKERSVTFLLIITIVLSIISSVAMIYAGHTGGQIRHSEFRSDSSRQYLIDHQIDTKESED